MDRRRFPRPWARLGAAVLLVLTARAARARDDAAGPIGFAPASRAAPAPAGAPALAAPPPERARGWLRTLTEEPHVAGTPADQKTAVFVRDRLREWGWQADLAEYHVLLNYPTKAHLQVTRPKFIELSC